MLLSGSRGSGLPTTLVFLLKDDLASSFKKHWVKSVRIRSFFDPYFPVFGLNAERYSVFFRIQSECGKIRTRKTPNTYNFYTVKTSEFLLFSWCFYSSVLTMLTNELLVSKSLLGFLF